MNNFKRVVIIMIGRSQRNLEVELLERVDELIDCLIASGLATGEQQHHEINIGIDKTKQIAELFSANFPQAVEYLDTALKEIVIQKLSDPQMLTQFLDVSENFEKVIQEGIRQFRLEDLLPFEPEPDEKLGWLGNQLRLELEEILEHPQSNLDWNSESNPELKLILEPGVEIIDDLDEINDLDDKNTVDSPSLCPVEWSLFSLYPGSRLIANHTLGNHTVPWYLPEHRLAFDWKTEDLAEKDIHKKFWELRGVSLIRLPKEDTGNHRAVERQIRRQLR
jgi:hypothetical protein